MLPRVDPIKCNSFCHDILYDGGPHLFLNSLRCKLSWRFVFDGKMNPVVAIVFKGLCKGRLGILVGLKLPGPYVLFFE